MIKSILFSVCNYRASVLSGFKAQLDDGVSMKNPTVALMGALVHSLDNV
jgi:hypothetical protein